MSKDSKEAEELKKKGNQCMKDGKHLEAMLHYTHAIKLDPKDHTLYSNRSLAFLKTDQHYFALEDGKQVIKLQPRWPKGYYRKGEAEYAAEHYKEALLSYRHGLSLEPEDEGLRAACAKASKALKQQSQTEERMPWIGIAVGALFGILIVIGDEALTKQPVLEYVALKIVVVVSLGAAGYGLALAYRYFLRANRASLLEEPADLFSDGDIGGNPPAPEPEPTTTHRKGTAAAARQRYKKGKS